MKRETALMVAGVHPLLNREKAERQVKLRAPSDATQFQLPDGKTLSVSAAGVVEVGEKTALALMAAGRWSRVLEFEGTLQ
jgi:hypothetical protein